MQYSIFLILYSLLLYYIILYYIILYYIILYYIILYYITCIVIEIYCMIYYIFVISLLYSFFVLCYSHIYIRLYVYIFLNRLHLLPHLDKCDPSSQPCWFSFLNRHLTWPEIQSLLLQVNSSSLHVPLSSKPKFLPCRFIYQAFNTICYKFLT